MKKSGLYLSAAFLLFCLSIPATAHEKVETIDSVLRVETDTENATVRVNGKQVGVTSEEGEFYIVLHGTKVGKKYTISVGKDGKHSYTYTAHPKKHHTYCYYSEPQDYLDCVTLNY